MRNKDVSQWKVSVLGAGSMGQCIAQFMAMNGHEVFLYNRTPANLEKALVQIENNLQTLVSMGQISQNQVQDTLKRISSSSDLKKSVEHADIVIENLAENEEVKKMIFSQLDQYCDDDVVFSSDTSTMNIFEFVKISHPERLIITHFFNPAHVMPLVELVRGPETSDETAEMTKSFLEGTGKKVAVLNKCIPGFILNRITLAVFREAAHIAEEGVASPADIDKAIVSTFGPRYAFEGPFGLSDFAGIDIYERLATLLPPVLCSDTECPQLLHDMTSAGKLGVKSGEGFYRYENEKEARRNRDTKIIKMIAAIKDVMGE
ncbi:MAG: 3-hydroxyacyl-CoA dehydrogenase family protein [Oliverpabstia sp.]